MNYTLKSILYIVLTLSSMSTFNAYSKDFRSVVHSDEFDFKIIPKPDVKEDEKFCAYESDSGICQVCYPENLGEKHGSCINSSQQSIGDCFAYCTPLNSEAKDACHFQPSTNLCIAVVNDDYIGSTQSNAEECIDYCAGNGVE